MVGCKCNIAHSESRKTRYVLRVRCSIYHSVFGRTGTAVERVLAPGAVAVSGGARPALPSAFLHPQQRVHALERDGQLLAHEPAAHQRLQPDDAPQRLQRPSRLLTRAAT